MVGLKPEEIGSVIKELRKRTGYTLVRLAELSGVDQGNLSRIETGKTIPSAGTLAKVMGALGVDPGPAALVHPIQAIQNSEFAQSDMFLRIDPPDEHWAEAASTVRFYRAQRDWPRFSILARDILMVDTAIEPTSNQLVLVDADGFVVPYQMNVVTWADKLLTKPSYFEIRPLMGEMPKDKKVTSAGPVIQLHRFV